MIVKAHVQSVNQLESRHKPAAEATSGGGGTSTNTTNKRKSPLGSFPSRPPWGRALTSCLVKSKQWPCCDKGRRCWNAPLSAGVIPEHTAVGAHQALGQRRAFLPFGKRVSSRGRAARGVNPASEGMDCQDDSTLLPLL